MSKLNNVNTAREKLTYMSYENSLSCNADRDSLRDIFRRKKQTYLE